tara:strand:+ start:556 stop:1074 length:519 start_codon:yes stop_codon:yes gene_type:complete
MAISEADKMKKRAENDPESHAFNLSWNKSNMNDLFNRMLKIGNTEKKLTPADRKKHVAGLEIFYSSDPEDQKQVTYGNLFDWHRAEAVEIFTLLLDQEREGLRPRGATLRLMKRYYPTIRDTQFKKGKITFKNDRWSATETIPQHLDELYKEAEKLSQKKRSMKSRSFKNRG